METHEIGGLILIAEADTRTCLRDKKTLAVEAEDSDDIRIVSRSWLSRFLYEVEQLILNWKTMDPVVDEISFIGFRIIEGFTDIHAQEYFSPFGWRGGGEEEHSHQLRKINQANLSVCFFS